MLTPGRWPGPSQGPRSGPTAWFGGKEGTYDFGYLMQSCRRPTKMGRRMKEKRLKGRRKGRKRPKTKRDVGTPRLPYAKLLAAPDLVRADDLGKAVGRLGRPEKAKKAKKTGCFCVSEAK